MTKDQIEGALWGLLVGDALGVPYEFTPPQELPRAEAIEMIPPAWFPRAHAGTPPGTWSDDGAQALCLLASLLDRGELDSADLGAKLLAWYERGFMAVDGRVFDVGISTAQALRRIRRGVAPEHAGSTEESSCGNGSLMRVLPLALWHHGDDRELIEDAHRQSLVTHGHPRCQVACALYCLWARNLAAGAVDGWDEAVATLRLVYPAGSIFQQELETGIRPDNPAPPRGTGYVVDSLHSARWALSQGSYEQVIKAAVGLGHDTDTTACIAGGLAGLRDGVAAVPRRWIEPVRRREPTELLSSAAASGLVA